MNGYLNVKDCRHVDDNSVTTVVIKRACELTGEAREVAHISEVMEAYIELAVKGLLVKDNDDNKSMFAWEEFQKAATRRLKALNDVESAFKGSCVGASPMCYTRDNYEEACNRLVKATGYKVVVKLI